ncbi:hypothetical protein [Bradyrhizobium uaiense]|nr:hypothetical protein [Bradyrhizobium uaiense]
MKTFAEAEALLAAIERDLDEVKSRRLRQLVREVIEEYRKQIQHLRKRYH